MKEITVEPLLDKHFKTKETCTIFKDNRIINEAKKDDKTLYK